MPAVRTKSGVRSQVKPSTKITISLPNELLEWCDVVAGVRHLERNDIIRQTIAIGLMVMQAENLRLSGHEAEVDAWFESRGASPEQVQEYSDRVGGLDGFVEKVRHSVREDARKLSEQS